MSKPVVAVTRKLPPAIETRMMELFEARLNENDQPLSAAEIVAKCDGAEVLVPTVTDAIDADLITALPDNIRLIANFGAGVDHIDLIAAAGARYPGDKHPWCPDRRYRRSDHCVVAVGAAPACRRRAAGRGR